MLVTPWFPTLSLALFLISIASVPSDLGATDAGHSDVRGDSSHRRSHTRNLIRRDESPHEHLARDESVIEVGAAGETQKFKAPVEVRNATDSAILPSSSPVSKTPRQGKRPAHVGRLEVAADGTVEASPEDAKEHTVAEEQRPPRAHVDDAAFREALLEEDLEDEVHENSTDLLISATLLKKGWWNRRRRVDCTFRGWGGWSNCNRGCGPGSKSRNRGINGARHGGRSCHGPLSQTSTCLIKHCPVDCKWSSWTGWTPNKCPVTCGGGKQLKTRRKVANAAYGGKNCDDDWLNQQEVVCATNACPIDCEWEAWQQWTRCPASCGGGSMKRIRDRKHAAYHGGKECDGLSVQESKDCNIHPCPIDCGIGEWTEWSECDADCGGGAQGRWRPCLVPNQHGGEPCPHLEENRSCNEEACIEVKNHAKYGRGYLRLFVVLLCASGFLHHGTR